MAADVTVLTTTVNANTSTGTQNITVGSLGTSPSAAIFFTSRVTSTSTEIVSPSFCIGFYDGTRNRSMSCHSEDAQTTSDTHRDYSILDAGRVFHSGDGTVDFEFNGDAFITNGVRIYISVSDGNDYKITAILFFGADVSNAYCNNVTVIPGSVTDVTAPGFEPDLVFFSGNGLNGASTQTHNLMNIGVAHNGGNQGSIYFSDVDSLTTTNSSTLLETNEVVGQMHNGSTTWVADCNTFDSSGFSLTTGESTGNDIVAYLALKFTNSPDIAVTTETGPTSTGNWSTTAPAFQPDFGMLLTLDNTATDTIDATDSDGFGVWCFDGTREYSIGMSSDDNVGTSDAYNRHSSDLTDYKDGNTTLHAGSFVSFDTNGATLNFTTVPGTARKWIGIWIGDASGGGPTTHEGACTFTFSASTTSARIATFEAAIVQNSGLTTTDVANAVYETQITQDVVTTVTSVVTAVLEASGSTAAVAAISAVTAAVYSGVINAALSASATSSNTAVFEPDAIFAQSGGVLASPSAIYNATTTITVNNTVAATRGLSLFETATAAVVANVTTGADVSLEGAITADAANTLAVTAAAALNPSVSIQTVAQAVTDATAEYNAAIAAAQAAGASATAISELFATAAVGATLQVTVTGTTTNITVTPEDGRLIVISAANRTVRALGNQRIVTIETIGRTIK